MKRIGIGLQVSLVIHGALLLGFYAMARHVLPEIPGRAIDLAILGTLTIGPGDGDTQAAGTPAAGLDRSPEDSGEMTEPSAPEAIAAPHPPLAAAAPAHPADAIDAGAAIAEIARPEALETDVAEAKPPPVRLAKEMIATAPPSPMPRPIPVTPDKKQKPPAESRTPSGKQKRTIAPRPAEKVPQGKPDAGVAAARGRPGTGRPARHGFAAQPKPDSGGGGGGAGSEDGYVQANYGAIHSRLASSLRYPSIARRRGWCGRVLVAFTVMPDGTVARPEIRKSSGFALLDNSAVQTVKDAGPFPRPGRTLRIVVPVVFRLES